MRCIAGTPDCPPSDVDALAGPVEAATDPVSALIHPRPIGGSALVTDYLGEVPTALRFYSGSPFRIDSFRAKLVDVDRRFDRPARERVAAILHPVSRAAKSRLERFVEDGGAVVTTGQQAGFLTGPLFTIYKALSAVALASHLERRLGVIVLPVFWAATDDHDWPEVNHSYLLDPAGRLGRFDLPTGDPRPLPMSERALSRGLEKICDDVVQYVGRSEHTREYLRRIVDPYRRRGVTVGEAFREAMGAILSAFDAFVADAADPVLKEASVPVLREALARAPEHETLLAERTGRIEADGYPVQVGVQPGATNVFIHGERGRERLHIDGSGFRVRQGRERFDREALLLAVETSPERFSPNVLLRPVVESVVFPTLAYVGGPGEVAYFAQAGAVFEAYGLAPPVVVPRFSGTIVEPAVERTMEALGIDEADLGEGRDRLLERLARREMPEAATRTLTRIRRDLVEGFDRLTEEVEGIDPTLIGALGAIRNRLLLGSTGAERKILRAIKRSEAIALSRLDRVLDTLTPLGKPQDRVLNVLPYLARFGENFLPAVERAIVDGWRFPEE